MKFYNKKWEIFYQTWLPFDDELNQYMEQQRLKHYKEQVRLKKKKRRETRAYTSKMNDKLT